MPAAARRTAAACAVIAMLAAVLVAWWPDERPPGAPGVDKGAEPAESSRRGAPRVGSPVDPDPGDPAPTDAPRREPVESAKAPPPPPPTSPDPLVGRVLHVDRTPATGATVRVGSASTVVDADGAFTLGREVVAADAALLATLTGYQPAVVEDLADHPDVRAGRPLEVVLRGRALEIDGWLVKDDGTPCADWDVELFAGTPSGVDAFPPITAEDLAAGAVAAEGTPEARSRRSTYTPPHNPNHRKTAADGAFRVGGLRFGTEYVLRAWNPSTLQTVISEPIVAGTRGYLFRVPTGVFRDHVTGRVIDRDGRPIEDVRVRLTMREHQSGGATSYQTGQTVHTAADGAFAFRHVPREDLLLRFDGPGVDSLYHEFRADDPGLDLEIRLACAARLRFEALPGGPQPTSLRVLDAEEHPLRISWRVGENRTRSSRSFALKDGGTPELQVSDAATWLVLDVAGRELRRIPLRLDRREVVVVRS